MNEKRRALGRGLGALIPSGPSTGTRPVDLLFRDAGALATRATDPEDRVRSDEGEPTPPSGGRDDDRNGEGAPGDQDGVSETVHDFSEGSQNVNHGAPGAEVDHPTDGRVPTQGQDDPGQKSRVAHEALTSENEAAASEHSAVVDAGVQLAPVPGATFAELPVGAIRPNPRQPRTVFDEDEMAELVHSISEIGVLQPIVVRPVSAGEPSAGEPSAREHLDGQSHDEAARNGETGAAAYELIMGERRWRAAMAAGHATIPAIIKETQDDALLRDALLENLHRAQLNPLEEAAAYQQLLDDFGCTQDELASRIGRSRPQISNTIRLLRLPPLVARRLAAGVLSAGHARALLSLPDGAAMERLAQRIVAEGLSVRGVEEIVALGGDDTPAARRRPRAGARHPQLDDLAARLSDRLDTRVGIALGQRKGKVTIEFASVEDLHRILQTIGLGEGS